MCDEYMFDNNSPTYYGGFRTKTFSEIFPTYTKFATIGIDGESTSIGNNTLWYIFGIQNEMDSTERTLMYYLLYSRYGNSHIANYIDEKQFLFSLFSTIFQYAPSWLKELEIQKKLRALTDDELILGGEATYNHAYNPETSPSTNSRDAINFINDQNKTLYTKSKMEGYATILSLLKTDVTENFLDKFQKLFIKVLAPDYPLLYSTEVSNG